MSVGEFKSRFSEALEAVRKGGVEPEAGAQETFAGGRDHRRVGERCSRSSL
jgi:hypothetical protein